METLTYHDAAIIGGSYAGLSSAMTLGRALRRVVIIDSGKPCNRQTPQSHNFITQDGETPANIARKAKEQVLAYDTVSWISDTVTHVTKTDKGFDLTTESGSFFRARKLVFATGISDLLPEIEGLEACWGISAIHCPYCHGYEVKHERTGIFMNGEMAFEMARLISNWTKDLSLFTNGACTLPEEQKKKLATKNIRIVENEIGKLVHSDGHLSSIVFTDGTSHELKALYLRPAFRQHSLIPEQLGCELTETGHLKVDQMQKTTVPGIYAAGDCTVMFRTVSRAVADGTMAGASLNKELIDADF